MTRANNRAVKHIDNNCDRAHAGIDPYGSDFGHLIIASRICHVGYRRRIGEAISRKCDAA